MLADGVLGVDLGDVGVALLDGLGVKGQRLFFGLVDGGMLGVERGKEGNGTFLSLFFSATSSLPALAAWRLSCFAVN